MPKNYKISHIIPKTLIDRTTSVVNSFNSIMGWDNKGIHLHQAIQDKNYDLIAEILSINKTNPNLKDAEGNVPLYYAFKLEDEYSIKALLNHRNIDLNSPLSLELSPLQNVALWGHAKYLKLLLDTNKIAINVTDEVGDNVLAYAIYSGNLDSVRILVDYPGLNLRHQNMFGCNVLHLASMNKQLAVVKLLLNKMDTYEELDKLNNTHQHFQNILVRVFGEDNELTAQQLDALKDIFNYRVLLNKQEIDNISNQELQNLVHDIDEQRYQAQYGHVKSVHSNKVNQIAISDWDSIEEVNLINYTLHRDDDMNLPEIHEEL